MVHTFRSLMAAPTLCIALLPSYSRIGVAAPVLLALMRVLQGLAAGGELPGALVYTVESVPPQMRGVFAALVLASSCGSLVASLVENALKLPFKPYEPGDPNSHMKKIVDAEGQNYGFRTFVEAMTLDALATYMRLLPWYTASSISPMFSRRQSSCPACSPSLVRMRRFDA